MQKIIFFSCLIAAFVLSRSQEPLDHHNKNIMYRQELTNFMNTQYYGSITIGDQNLTAIYDTGSFEILVVSKRCKMCRPRKTLNVYDNSMSDHYEKNGTITRHVFGSGPVVSIQGYDNVAVGPMTVKHQAFWEIIRHQIPVLDHARFNAIVGIGPHDAPPGGGTAEDEQTLLSNLDVDKFSVCFEKPSGSPGWINWHENIVATNHFYAFLPMIGKIHWAVQLKDFDIVNQNDNSFTRAEGVCTNGIGCAAIIDSGTSLIAAPGVHLNLLSDLIGNVKEDCSNLDELPTLQFRMGNAEDGNIFELPPSSYIMKTSGEVVDADTVWDLLFFKPKMKKVNQCMPAFMQIDKNSKSGPVWIIGMPFFREYKVTFDRNKKEILTSRAGDSCEGKPFVKETDINLLRMHNGKRRMKQRQRQVPIEIDLSKVVIPSWYKSLEYLDL